MHSTDAVPSRECASLSSQLLMDELPAAELIRRQRAGGRKGEVKGMEARECLFVPWKVVT